MLEISWAPMIVYLEDFSAISQIKVLSNSFNELKFCVCPNSLFMGIIWVLTSKYSPEDFY